MKPTDINWALVSWTQYPSTLRGCSSEKYTVFKGVSYKRRCDSRHVRKTPEGRFCIDCWQALPVCDICQQSKATQKHHHLNLCVSCYLPEYSPEYLARSAEATLCGESVVAQIENIGESS